jgi:hypothetical protein
MYTRIQILIFYPSWIPNPGFRGSKRHRLRIRNTVDNIFKIWQAEELERCNLLTAPEVKELLRRRKHFEYKIQKRTKKKEDFLRYSFGLLLRIRF